MKQFMILLALIALTSACSEYQGMENKRDLLRYDSYSGFDDSKSHEIDTLRSQTLTVVDAHGSAVAQAKVMIGPAPGVPFAGNIIQTDHQGQFRVPARWTQALPVTIKAANYTQTTYLDVYPSARSFQLQPQDTKEQIKVEGETRNFGQLRRDGNLHFGLVLPALSRRQLLNFDISQIISPESDTIRVLGQSVDLPSNLTLPRQSETYIFPITFDKPKFRSFVRKPGEYNFVATHGRFPLSRVINEIRAGRSLFEVINHFTFIGGGSQFVQVSPQGAQQDINVDSMSFSHKVSVPVPTVPADKEVVIISLAQTSAGLLFPTDLKRGTGQPTLDIQTLPNTNDQYLLHLLTNADKNSLPVPDFGLLIANINPMQHYLHQLDEFNPEFSKNTPDFDQLSFVLKASQSSAPAHFLPHIPRPVRNGDQLLLFPPELVSGVQPMGTYVVLSEIQTGASTGFQSEIRTRVWEFMADSWVTEINIPQVSFELAANKKYRWEVLYLGRDASLDPAHQGVYSLDAITHLTRNALDF